MVLCTMPQLDEEDKKWEMNFHLIGLILKKKNLLNLAHPYEARGAYYN